MERSGCGCEEEWKSGFHDDPAGVTSTKQRCSHSQVLTCSLRGLNLRPGALLGALVQLAVMLQTSNSNRSDLWFDGPGEEFCVKEVWVCFLFLLSLRGCLVLL